jgi:hypothetical protein
VRNENKGNMVLEDEKVDVGPIVSLNKAFPERDSNETPLHGQDNQVGEYYADNSCALANVPKRHYI